MFRLLGVFLQLFLSIIANNIVVVASDLKLEEVFQEMNPLFGKDQWHIHDPSRVGEVPSGQMIAVTGQAQEDGYECR